MLNEYLEYGEFRQNQKVFGMIHQDILMKIIYKKIKWVTF